MITLYPDGVSIKGCTYIYRKDDGTAIDTKTISAATILSGHTAVVWLKEISGCVALDRVSIR